MDEKHINCRVEMLPAFLFVALRSAKVSNLPINCVAVVAVLPRKRSVGSNPTHDGIVDTTIIIMDNNKRRERIDVWTCVDFAPCDRLHIIFD